MCSLLGTEGEVFGEWAFEGDDIRCTSIGQRDSVWVDSPEGSQA